MGLAYLFALVVALGVLGVQIALGMRDAHPGDVAHGGHGQPGHAHSIDGEPAFWTVLLSLRFWTFFLLGFGLSGSLIHLFALAPPLATFLVALVAGAASGLFAALAFRLLRRTSATTEARASQAVGRVARVVVPCGPGVIGQVRLELGGGSVDLMATTEDEQIAKGEAVLIEEVNENVAKVSRRPDELG